MKNAHTGRKTTEDSCMWGIIFALISGALMSIQGVFNTEVTKAGSIWTATGFVQLTAFLTCVAAWFFSGREPVMDIFQVEHKYTLLGGVIGAFITYTVIKSMGDLGPAKAVLIIVVSQVLVAWLIELFGLFGTEKAAFEWHKLIGMLLAIGGIVVFKWS
jgi:transporter family-2 protein